MKKALHNKNDLTYYEKDGLLKAWRIDVNALIKASNDTSDFEELEENGERLLKKDGVVVPGINDNECFSALVHDWMSYLVDEGLTEMLTFELNIRLENIRYIHRLMPASNGSTRWLKIVDMNKGLTVQEQAGFAFSHQLAIGAFDGLQRCQLPECKKFFIGRPNSKWCSKSCGSKYRVREKRKRDLE